MSISRGSRLGSYEITSRLGAGGMGEVYRARDTRLQRDGGVEPAWAPGGREIFYRTADSLMAAPVATQPALSVGTARALFPDHYDRWSREDGSRNYDVSPDGSRFLFIRSQDLRQEPVTRLNLMTIWPAAVGGPQTEKK
jgi:serine/threonine protein kinase